jgi:hypothetical protein
VAECLTLETARAVWRVEDLPPSIRHKGEYIRSTGEVSLKVGTGWRPVYSRDRRIHEEATMRERLRRIRQETTPASLGTSKYPSRSTRSAGACLSDVRSQGPSSRCSGREKGHSPRGYTCVRSDTPRPRMLYSPGSALCQGRSWSPHPECPVFVWFRAYSPGPRPFHISF